MIQNGQDMEEALDEMKAQAKVTEERLNREVNFLVDQIEMLEANVKRENEKVEDLEVEIWKKNAFSRTFLAKLMFSVEVRVFLVWKLRRSGSRQTRKTVRRRY